MPLLDPLNEDVAETTDATTSLVVNETRPSSQASKHSTIDIRGMSLKDRFRFVRTLWPYMIPLFVVYFSECKSNRPPWFYLLSHYLAQDAMQSGTWAVIGFPVTSKDARQKYCKAALGKLISVQTLLTVGSLL